MLIETIKNRLGDENALNFYKEIAKENNRIILSYNNIVDLINHFYFENNHYCIINNNLPVNEKQVDLLLNKYDNKTFSFFDTKIHITGILDLIELSNVNEELFNHYKTLKKLLYKGFSLYKVNLLSVHLHVNNFESYDLNINKNQFASTNTKYLILGYDDNEVILNIYEENNEIFALTKKDSKKMEYLKKKQPVTIYYESNKYVVNIELKEELTTKVYDKLQLLKNNYFKENNNLIALSFKLDGDLK